MTAPNAAAPQNTLAGKYPPAWRRRELSPETLRTLRDEEARLHSFYASILAHAADKDYPLEELFGRACRLCLNLEQPPGPEDMAAYAAILRDLDGQKPHAPAQDAAGNPLWISLTLRDRHDDGPIAACGVLPLGDESAAPHGSLPDKEKKPTLSFGPFASLSRFFGGGRKAEEEAPFPRRGRTTPPKPSALRSFIKMLVIGVCLALLWHFLRAVSH